jgi:hypothetical protein
MRLFMAVSTSYARHIIDVGFEGVPTTTYPDETTTWKRVGKHILPYGPDDQPAEGQVWEYVPLRDAPPSPDCSVAG